MTKSRFGLFVVTSAVFFVFTSCVGKKVVTEDIMTPQPPRQNPTRFEFPVGYEEFHDDVGINFLLNRTYSMGYAEYEDMADVGKRIISFEDVTTQMAELAQTAESEGRLLNAALYYRAAEFYTSWSDAEKDLLYERFISNFYAAIPSGEFELDEIAYDGTFVPVMRVPSRAEESAGTIVVHSGYDGYKEELYSTMSYLAAHGYDVINFDVPWMNRSGTQGTNSFDYHWEKIIGAVLDHYGEDDVTLFGLSFGGWLALRAAAFEPRISRVVASSVSFDVNQYVGRFSQAFARFARIRMPEFTNKQIEKQMETDPQSAWFFDHLMHATRTDTPLEAANILAEINEENLHSELVTQDVLILTGIDDHAIPFKMHGMQVKALVNARSVTPAVFTEEVQGHNHCQVGNIGLALDVVLDWIAETAGKEIQS